MHGLRGGARCSGVESRSGRPYHLPRESVFLLEQVEDHGENRRDKKLPKEVAVINADNCTGCEACLEVCPVDCIVKVPGDTISVLQSFCEIDVERCVGCEVCVHIPTKKTDPYELTVCPWDAIEMIPTVEVAQYVATRGGRRNMSTKTGIGWSSRPSGWRNLPPSSPSALPRSPLHSRQTLCA